MRGGKHFVPDKQIKGASANGQTRQKCNQGCRRREKRKIETGTNSNNWKDCTGTKRTSSICLSVCTWISMMYKENIFMQNREDMMRLIQKSIAMIYTVYIYKMISLCWQNYASFPFKNFILICITTQVTAKKMELLAAVCHFLGTGYVLQLQSSWQKNRSFLSGVSLRFQNHLFCTLKSDRHRFH